MALAGALMALLAILSVAISRNPTPSTDEAAMDWVVAWIAPGLAGLFDVVSFLTSAKAGLIYGPVGMALLLFLRKRRAAVEFAVVGGVVALVAVLGDYTLGEAVGRTRPLGACPRVNCHSEYRHDPPIRVMNTNPIELKRGLCT